MPTFYSIAQYVPSPLADERMNFAIIVVEGAEVRIRTTTNWERLKRFGDEDIGFLQDFTEHLHAQADTEKFPLFQREAALAWREETIRTISSEWKNSIQITEPRASLKSADQLVEELVTQYLRERKRKSRARDRRAVVSKAWSILETKAVSMRLPYTKLVRREIVVGGVDKHRFDILGQNGSLRFAAQGLSFEVPAALEMESVAWAVDDVRKSAPNLPISILYMPPKETDGTSDVFERAARIFPALGAEFVPELQIEDWATRTLQSLR